jgi:hypothetical protein
MGGTIYPLARRALPARWLAPGHAGGLRKRRRWLAPLTFAVAGVSLFALFLGQARTVPANSDGASNALQAWDMLHGNAALRGWSLSDVSFYTTELPQYALVEALRGLNPDTVHVAAAMTYTLVVLLAAALARGRAAGAEGLARALLAAGIMLAPQAGDGRLVLLSSPDHTGTQVPLLLAWLVLDRARPRWWVPLAVTAILTWAQIADPITAVEGAAPLLVVCAVRLWRRREAWRQQWFELSLAAGSIAAVAAADLALALIRHAGGFAVQVPATAFTSLGQIPLRLWYTAEDGLVLYGADIFGQPTVTAAALVLLHLAGVAVAAWAVARAVRGFLRAEMVLQVLTAAFIVLVAAYLASAKAVRLSTAREVVGLLPIGAVLAGRLVAGRPIPRWLTPAALAVLTLYAGAAVYDAAQMPPPDPDQQVASWLQAHHLTNGIAGYWQASSVTVDSSGKVQVSPVSRAGRGLRAFNWEARRSWYDPRRHDAVFFIYSPADGRSAPFDTPTPAEAETIFGRPWLTCRIAGEDVLVWHKNLLNDLPPWLPWPASRVAGTLSPGALLG